MFDCVQLAWTLVPKRKFVHDRLGELQPLSLKDKLGTREVDRGHKKEKAGQEGALGGKQVETRVCDRCEERGHLRKACPNPKKPKGGKKAAAA